ncbi:hypothetical protein [Porphyromonas loveana]|uniref:hypothetical protein n=1 Tax=Porphyromonas loveana TaxID=1884669 RepID=UPI0035A0558F
MTHGTDLRPKLSPYDYVRLQAIRLGRYLLHRRGHGVHSPYVFYLITRVIEERTPYYCFASLAAGTRDVRRRCSYSGIANERVLELIFRLVLYTGAKRCIAFSPDSSVLKQYVQAAFSTIAYVSAKDLDTTPLVEKSAPVLMVVEEEALATAAMSALAEGSFADGSILVLHCPRRRGAVRTLCQQMWEHPEARILVDVGEVFIVVFHSGLNKRRYKAFL